MTSDGLLFGPQGGRSAYLCRKDHRLTGGSRNKWSCTHQEEYVVFCDAEVNAWIDSRPQLWGLLPGLPEIGTKRERIAKFPRPSNATDAWHGYPVSALDDKREFEHRPEPALVERWRLAGLIDDIQASRINRGKV